MSYEAPVTATRPLGSLRSRIAAGFQVLFWLTAFIIFPLASAPDPSGLILHPEEWVLFPKALTLAITFAIGTLALMLTYESASFGALIRSLRSIPMFVAGTLLLILSTPLIEGLNSSNLAISALGSSTRMDGILVHIAWYGLGLCAFFLVRKPLIPLALTMTSFIVGTLFVGIWAALQSFFVEPWALLGWNHLPTGNPSATIGHRALVACLVGMGLALPLVKGSLSRKAGFPMIAATFLFGGLLVAAEGRAGMVGVLGVWVLLGALIVVKRRPVRQFVIVSTALVLGAGLVAVLKPDGSSQFVSLADATQGTDGSFKARYAYYWPIAVKAIGDRPLKGWGIGGFSRAFWTYATEEEQFWVVRNHISRTEFPELQTTGSPIQVLRRSSDSPVEVRVWTVDRAHNAYLDIAVAFGVPYLCLYLVVLSTWVYSLFRTRSQLAIAFGLAAVVHLIFGLAWFDTLQLSPLLWMLIGASSGLAGHKDLFDERAIQVN